MSMIMSDAWATVNVGFSGTVRYADKVLPNQPYFRNLYSDKEPFESRLYSLLSSYAPPVSDDLILPESTGFEEMSSPPWLLAFFSFLIKSTGATRILEIGSFIGHSAIELAKAVGPNGHVTTLEVGPEFASMAIKNIARHGLESYVSVYQADAGALPYLFEHARFDLVFIDGGKERYLDYALKAKTLLSDHGMILVDDVFFHGDALNVEPSTDKGYGCRALLDHFRDDAEFEHCILPVANGLLMLWRK